jgi:hypothetical protein
MFKNIFLNRKKLPEKNRHLRLTTKTGYKLNIFFNRKKVAAKKIGVYGCRVKVATNINAQQSNKRRRRELRLAMQIGIMCSFLVSQPVWRKY